MLLNRELLVFTFYLVVTLIATFSAVTSAQELVGQDNGRDDGQRDPGNGHAKPPPVNYGIVLFPSFQALDVFGPLDALNILSLSHPLNLFILSVSLDPVSTKARSASMNPFNSNFSQSILPTHTFSNSPSDLEVLIIPGGLGTRAPELEPIISYVKATYPRLRYLFTVCTGAGIAARAGVLDGRKATTNKASWNSTVALGPKVKWVKKARWVVDGKVWTSSGVSAGIDATLAFVKTVYGKGAARETARLMEYVPEEDPKNDPFAVK